MPESPLPLPAGSCDTIDFPFSRLHVSAISEAGLGQGPTHVGLMLPLGSGGEVLSVVMDQGQCDQVLAMIWECRKACGWTGDLNPAPWLSRDADGVRRVQAKRRT